MRYRGIEWIALAGALAGALPGALAGALACSLERSEDGSVERGDVRLSIDSVLVVDVGHAAPDEDAVFLRPLDGTRLPAGTIVVADAWVKAILFFDPSGRTARRVGREGSGPGEFRGPGWVQRCSGDSLFVWDRRRSAACDEALLIPEAR